MSNSDPVSVLLPIERAVLDMVFPADCPFAASLRAQLQRCAVKSRDYSGVGFFTHISPNPSAPPIENTGRIWLGGVWAEMEGTRHGAGFALLIENGYFEMLEGFTYDDPWPDPVKGFVLMYVDTAEKHCAELRRALES